MRYFVTVAGAVTPVELSEVSAGDYRVEHGGRSFSVRIQGDNVLVDGRVVPCRLDPKRGRADIGTQSVAYEISRNDPKLQGSLARSARPELRSPMPGKVIEVRASEGSQVNAGDCLVVIEAMKMQNELSAPVSGTVRRVLVTAGK